MAKAATSTALDPGMRIAVLHGKDAYLQTELTRRFRQGLREKFGEIEEVSFDGGATGLANVLDEVRSYGLLQVHKLVVVDQADQLVAGEDRRRHLERYAAAPMAESTLLLRATTWRPGNLDKAIEKAGGGIVKCEPPGEDRAIDFCLRRAPKQHGVPIDEDAATLLVERIGADLARLDGELGKLAAAVCDRPEPRIGRADVAALCGASREEQSWIIQDALLSGRPEVALAKLRELIDVSQVEPQTLVWSTVEVARKVHDASRLLARGEPEMAVSKALKLWGSTQGPILRAARSIRPEVAARLLDAALAIDLGVRRGVTRSLERTLEGFSVRMADTLRSR
jgi:DNA polymerase-3 subunit delta